MNEDSPLSAILGAIPCRSAPMDKDSTSPLHASSAISGVSRGSGAQMDADSTSAMSNPLHSNPQSSPNPQLPPINPPTSSRPIPLPPVPTALADIIGQAVAEHLSSGIVEPTVRGIIDACVPCLAEIFENRLAARNLLLTTGGSCPTTSNGSAGPDAQHGSDGDDEEGVLPPQRKKSGPRGKLNHLHHAFRIYLRDKKIVPTGPKAKLPISAPTNAIHAFNQNGKSPPVLENLTLDWASNPLSTSRWNREAISILSPDFHTQLKNKAYKDVVYDEETMNLPAICRLCEKKLVRTHQAHCKEAKINNATADERQQVISNLHAQEEKHLKDERKVSHQFGTLARHKRIVAENCH
ncbi:hypothetical protein JVT61DRAFT_14409 [Boletus reticuloceps]|uniref:Uncharacterized protein n=1 Tax=Boletus reticuloceps TaxID=495285 RepID=A0A8I2YSH5_9AGAM|nr:hypothetical protein JVT61DRAFT_14409 [Boletus reticuloceps]